MTFEEHIRHGIDLAREGDLPGAEAAFLAAEGINPRDPLPRNLLGKVYLAGGHDKVGVEALVEAVRRDPQVEMIFDLVQALNHLHAHIDVERVCAYHERQIAGDDRFLPYRGMGQLQTKQVHAAIDTLSRALANDPANPAHYHNLSVALIEGGRAEEAVECFCRLLPDWDGGAAEVTSVERLDAIAEGYDVKDLHNYFSDRMLRLYLDVFPGRRLRRVLELGTGTGLLASKLPASATSVTGIERSPAMLEQARARKVYDTLVEGDLPGALDSVDGPFETILAACMLYYFADLRPFFVHAARLLEPDGVFLFSVDPLSDPRQVAVTKPGEYAHSRAYLRRLAEETGFLEVAIEIDRHRGSPGFWCAFRKG
ncbi:Predicted methyltransferase [Magnetospirillum sp. XM-1]|uniref:methyltransferase domain-containing protein n=1 Tax=Magnetospirillum sp. XM-1 TaxID=1663591 RepID=UPI00073E0D5D|nr:methyltransferase domain-containing protein [Magnetospirillum sp. XM-1]CUW39188.1 Predicted methyltransferase [Magnetospirillum sp. XM-1]